MVLQVISESGSSTTIPESISKRNPSTQSAKHSSEKVTAIKKIPPTQSAVKVVKDKESNKKAKQKSSKQDAHKKKLDIISAKAKVVSRVLDLRDDPSPEISVPATCISDDSDTCSTSEDQFNVKINKLEEENLNFSKEIKELNRKMQEKNREIAALKSENSALKLEQEKYSSPTAKPIDTEFSNLQTLLCLSTVQDFVKELGKLTQVTSESIAPSASVINLPSLSAVLSPRQSAIKVPVTTAPTTVVCLPVTSTSEAVQAGGSGLMHTKSVDTVAAPQSSSEQELVPGSGVMIQKLKLSAIISKGASMSRLTKHLLEAFFEDEVLASSNFDGGGPNNYKALDKKTTNALKDFVRQRFPGSKDRDIVKKINEKCVDARKMLKKKLQTCPVASP